MGFKKHLLFISLCLLSLSANGYDKIPTFVLEHNEHEICSAFVHPTGIRLVTVAVNFHIKLSEIFRTVRAIANYAISRSNVQGLDCYRVLLRNVAHE